MDRNRLQIFRLDCRRRVSSKGVYRRKKRRTTFMLIDYSIIEKSYASNHAYKCPLHLEWRIGCREQFIKFETSQILRKFFL